MSRPPAVLGFTVDVLTCIGCGARTRLGTCDSGCPDVPLDLVEADALASLGAAVRAREARACALRDAAAAIVAADADGDGDALRRRVVRALRYPAPAADPTQVEVVAAWGCPDCGRVDAPRECIGVCIRRPVPMVDACGLGALRRRLAVALAADGHLTAALRLAASVRPRPGSEEVTRRALADRARRALAIADGPPEREPGCRSHRPPGRVER